MMMNHCARAAACFFCLFLGSVGMASCVVLLIDRNTWGMIPVSGVLFGFYMTCGFYMMCFRAICQLFPCETGSSGHTSTTIFWVCVTVQETDSLSDETEPSSIVLEDSGIEEEDATAADGFLLHHDSIFWKTVGAVYLGYLGVALPLHIFWADGGDDVYPWYIVAPYFALPVFCMVCCCAPHEPNNGVLSSEEEDRITRTSITTKKKTSGGEDESVEKMLIATAVEIV